VALAATSRNMYRLAHSVADLTRAEIAVPYRGIGAWLGSGAWPFIAKINIYQTEDSEGEVLIQFEDPNKGNYWTRATCFEKTAREKLTAASEKLRAEIVASGRPHCLNVIKGYYTTAIACGDYFGTNGLRYST